MTSHFSLTSLSHTLNITRVWQEATAMSTDERTPLLTKPLPSLPTLIPAPQPTRPSSPYSHIVASLAAVRAGKLPTTRQAESILKALLDSPLFGDDDDGRKLSKRGDNVRSATREVLEAIGEVLKRCEGDSWQHVFWEWRGVDVSVGAFSSLSRYTERHSTSSR